MLDSRIGKVEGAGPAPRAELPGLVTDASKRHDFVWLFDCTEGNPNGDPDNDGAPRMDPETRHGIVTGQRLRRAIRNRVAHVSAFEPEERRQNLKIFIEHGAVLNEKIKEAYIALDLPVGRRIERSVDREETRREIGDLASAGLLPEPFEYRVEPSGEDASLVYAGELAPRELKRALDDLGDEISRRTRSFIEGIAREAGSPEKTRDKAEAARAQMDLNYWDVRTFGAVMSTGLDADRETGAVQIPDCRSVDPITPEEVVITRGAVTREEERDEKVSTMGTRHRIHYGLYYVHGFFNPLQAAKNGVTDEDLALLWRSLEDPWSLESRTNRGVMTTVSSEDGGGVHVFTHDHPMGNAPAHLLQRRVKARLREGVAAPRGINDYEISIDLEGMTSEVAYSRLF